MEPGEALLENTRILLIEDSALIALDIADGLAAAGCSVIGPARKIEECVKLIERSGRIDCVLLDINLGDGRSSLSLLPRLMEKKIPVIFVTGYDARAVLPTAYRDFPVVEKPVTGSRVLAEIEKLLDRSKG